MRERLFRPFRFLSIFGERLWLGSFLIGSKQEKDCRICSAVILVERPKVSFAQCDRGRAGHSLQQSATSYDTKQSVKNFADLFVKRLKVFPDAYLFCLIALAASHVSSS